MIKNLLDNGTIRYTSIVQNYMPRNKLNCLHNSNIKYYVPNKKNKKSEQKEGSDMNLK